MTNKRTPKVAPMLMPTKTIQSEMNIFRGIKPAYCERFFFKYITESSKTRKIKVHVIDSFARSFEESYGMVAAAIFPKVPEQIDEETYLKLKA